MSRFVNVAAPAAAAQPAAIASPFQSSDPSPVASIPSPLRGEFSDTPSRARPSNGIGAGDAAGTTALWLLAVLLIIALIEVRAFFKLRRQK
jgi:hypothetical protein